MTDLEQGTQKAEDLLGKYPSAKPIIVSYQILSVSEIESISCTFNCEIILTYKWVDPMMIGLPIGTAIDFEDPKFKKAFDPELEILNEFELEEAENNIKVGNEKGLVIQTVHVKGKLAIKDMDLTMFPFDVQNLSVIIKSHRLQIQDLVLLPNREDSSEESHRQHEWKHLSHCMKEYSSDPNTSSSKKVYSVLHVIAMVQREGNWFVNNIMAISFGLILIALTCCSMAIHDQQGRMDVAILTLLAAITNKFIVAEDLPKIPYRTLIDTYLDVCFVMHMLVILSNVVVLEFTNDPMWGHLGENLNPYLFYIFMSIFGSFHIWLVVAILEYRADVEDWVRESNMIGPVQNLRRMGSYFRPEEQQIFPEYSTEASIEQKMIELGLWEANDEEGLDDNGSGKVGGTGISGMAPPTSAPVPVQATTAVITVPASVAAAAAAAPTTSIPLAAASISAGAVPATMAGTELADPESTPKAHPKLAPIQQSNNTAAEAIRKDDFSNPSPRSIPLPAIGASGSGGGGVLA